MTTVQAIITKHHTGKSGTNANGPWIQARITCEDGKDYSFFYTGENAHEELSQWQMSDCPVGSLVEFEYVQKGNFNNVDQSKEFKVLSKGKPGQTPPPTKSDSVDWEAKDLRITRLSAQKTAATMFNINLDEKILDDNFNTDLFTTKVSAVILSLADKLTNDAWNFPHEARSKKKESKEVTDAKEEGVI